MKDGGECQRMNYRQESIPGVRPHGKSHSGVHGVPSMRFQQFEGKTAITFGVFDLLHFGHFELFRRIRELVGANGRVWIMLQIDESIKRYKPGCKSVYDFEKRKSMIETLRTVDRVIPYDAVGVEAVKELNFDVLICGPEHTNERFQKLFKWCEQNGKEVIVLPRTGGISTTTLKSIIRDL